MYKSAADSIESMADTWPSSHPDLKDYLEKSPLTSGNHTPYRALPALIQNRLKDSGDSRLQQLGQSFGVQRALGVIARYYCHALQSAVFAGVSQTSAVSHLAAANESAQTPMVLLARYPNIIAAEYENMLGVAKDNYCAFDAQHSTNYRWADGRLLTSDFLKASLDATKADLVRRSQDQPIVDRTGREVNLSGVCPAEKAGQLSRICQAVLTICDSDKLLAERTYQLGVTDCAPRNRSEAG